jgi:hypothetical protein
LLVHLICPRPEFLDRGKSSVAAHSPGFAAISEAVEFVTADWAKQRRSEVRNKALEEKRLEKMRVQKPAPGLSLKDLVLKPLPAVIRQISEDERLGFTQRDIFYAIRPLVQQEQEKSLYDGYFTALITDYENERGEIPGMQREPRGTLYHPHLRQEIPLSTESVANYGRPFWTFNKMVYIEKAGTQQNLIEVGWPEEFDAAIASVAGFTTRAVKDLFDLLATSSEPVTVFCVHDADAAGTMIYHTLQNETKARAARKIEVWNHGKASRWGSSGPTYGRRWSRGFSIASATARPIGSARSGSLASNMPGVRSSGWARMMRHDRASGPRRGLRR